MDEQTRRVRVFHHIRRRQQHPVGIGNLAVTVQVLGFSVRPENLRGAAEVGFPRPDAVGVLLHLGQALRREEIREGTRSFFTAKS